MKSVRVDLAGRAYDVVIGEGVLAEVGERVVGLGKWDKVAVVTDSNVGPLYADEVLESLGAAGMSPVLVTVPAGETAKSLACVEMVCDEMIAAGLDRGALLVALGGGVVGDLAGFVAAVYFRGIPFVQVPTTVMAQVDSSVGGKTGVNAQAGKNLIGAFHQPLGVLADPETLGTLPEREFNEGFAEVIKHAVIADAAMLEALVAGSHEDLGSLIARNVAIKADVVVADEFERSGRRALLNFGHTIGHAVEQAAGYGNLLHGEAVAIGLHAALRLSVARAGLPEAECARVLGVLRAFNLPVTLPTELSTDEILAAMVTDKKFAGGAWRFVLTERLGSAFVTDAVTRDDVVRVLGEIGGGGG